MMDTEHRSSDVLRRPPPSEWGDWRRQMSRRITTLAGLREWIHVSPAEEEAIRKTEGLYRWSVTQHYASLMDPDDENCPIRLQAIPHLRELAPDPLSDVDPVGDMTFRKTNRVIHKYPDRIVMLMTAVCPVYCRHCTRKYHTTDMEGTYFAEKEALSFEEDFRYIEAHPEIRDVLLTGGDPLLKQDYEVQALICRQSLETLLGSLSFHVATSLDAVCAMYMAVCSFRILVYSP